MSKSISALISIAALALACVGGDASAQPHAPATAQVSVCFVPAQSCRGEIVAAIDAAKSQIRLQAFKFDVPEIASALVAARKRGVDIAIIFAIQIERRARKAACEGTGVDYGVPESVVDAGIPVFVDAQGGKSAHNKVLIVDGELVLGGSYNYAERVESKNADNLISIRSKEVASWYLENWQSRQAVSRQLRPLVCKQ